MKRDDQRNPNERFGRRAEQEDNAPGGPITNETAPPEYAAPNDIGDIPPPPAPPPPPPVVGTGLGGLPGTGGTSFARPGSLAARPFQSAPAQPRFGPGVPTIGSGDFSLFGPEQQRPLRDDDLESILAGIASKFGGQQ